MDLKTEIKPELWKAVEKTYRSKKYHDAIVAAVKYMSDVTRDLSGVEEDGAKLYGIALSGDTPKLRLNDLATSSDKSEQTGYFNIVQGIYSGIRNPRSHEQDYKDSKETADAVIVFINFLCERLYRHVPEFFHLQWIEKLKTAAPEDSEYAETQFAMVMVGEVPPKKRMQVLEHLIAERHAIKPSIRWMTAVKKFMALLSTAARKKLSIVVADALSKALVQPGDLDREDIDNLVTVLEESDWLLLPAPLRREIEKLMVESFDEAQMVNDWDWDKNQERDDPNGLTIGDAVLLNNAMRLAEHFIEHQRLVLKIWHMVDEGTHEQRIFVAFYGYEILVKLPVNSWYIEQFVKRIEDMFEERLWVNDFFSLFEFGSKTHFLTGAWKTAYDEYQKSSNAATANK